jgi:hypothetical protein
MLHDGQHDCNAILCDLPSCAQRDSVSYQRRTKGKYPNFEMPTLTCITHLPQDDPRLFRVQPRTPKKWTPMIASINTKRKLLSAMIGSVRPLAARPQDFSQMPSPDRDSRPTAIFTTSETEGHNTGNFSPPGYPNFGTLPTGELLHSKDISVGLDSTSQRGRVTRL